LHPLGFYRLKFELVYLEEDREDVVVHVQP
jgi:hypothetical protein